MQNDTRKTAVLMVCDANFLPFALHLMNQIMFFCPHRTFDLIVASEEALALPQWAQDAGVLFHQMATGDFPPDLPAGPVVRASFYRIKAPDQLASCYRRLLYLDCDILMEGGDLERLINIELGDHPIAAVMAPLFYKSAGNPVPEYRIVGMPALPYFNTGVMVIDTDAYLRERLSERCIEVILKHREAILLADQSAYNIVLRGRFALLSPVWNWMNNREYPFVIRRMPVRFHHFIGKTKPWNDVEQLDIRFRESYANFFRTHMPEALPMLKPTAAPRILPLERLISDFLSHVRRRQVNAERFGGFRDEWDVKL
jgi:hypothetical protein